MSDPVILDADPYISTGVPADPERVAELIADPTNDITADIVDALPAEQQPTPEQIAAAEAAVAGE